MDLESLKHKELQSLCKSANIKAAGKKQELIERLEEHYKSLEAAVAAEPADHVKFQDTGLDLPVAALSLQSKIAKPNLKTAESLKTPSIVKPLIPIVPKKTLVKERTAEPTKSEPEIGAKPKKFDLQESLKRPLTYKPHVGKLKPFSG